MLALAISAFPYFLCEEVRASTVPTASAAGTILPPPTPETEDPSLGIFTFLTKIPGDYGASAKTMFAQDQIVPWAAVVGSTAGLMKYDYELWKPFSDWHARYSGFRNQTEFGWNVGKGGFQFGIAGGFLAYGTLFGQHRALRTASQIVEVVLLSGIATQVLKHITGRESPSVATTVRTGYWHWFPNPSKYSKRVSAFDAFPSGHIATTFSTARVIQLNYPEYTWIPYVAYPVVGFVMVSMVATNGHWWSDYPLSLMLAYHFANAVTRGNSNRLPEKLTAWHVDPYVPGGDKVGLLVRRLF
jgi:hypothetical protein